MRIDSSCTTACLVLMMMMTLAVSVTARPRSLRQIARMQRKIKEKTSMAFSKRTETSEEIQRDEDKGQVLAKLLGLEAYGTEERGLKPNPFSAELLDSSSAPRHGETGPLRSDESTKETSQGKSRVRRRCPAGQWPCKLPTSPSQIFLIAADALRPRSKELPLSSQARRKGSGQAKRRVRRRCPAGQWPCPTGSSSKHVLP